MNFVLREIYDLKIMQSSKTLSTRCYDGYFTPDQILQNLLLSFTRQSRKPQKNKPTGFDQTRAKKVLKEAWVMFVSRAKVS